MNKINYDFSIIPPYLTASSSYLLNMIAITNDHNYGIWSEQISTLNSEAAKQLIDYHLIYEEPPCTVDKSDRCFGLTAKGRGFLV